MTAKKLIYELSGAIGIKTYPIVIEPIEGSRKAEIRSTNGNISIVMDNRKINISKITPDDIFFISHELWHIRQIETGEFDPLSYSPDSTNLESYNSQPIERDAHAFSFAVCATIFGAFPVIYAFSEELNNNIREKALEMKSLPCMIKIKRIFLRR